MKNKMNLRLLLIAIIVLIAAACDKYFLEEKPDKALLIPESLSDFQALLDNASIMNQTPYLPLVACDDLYTSDAGYNSTSSLIRNTYIWRKDDLYEGATTVHDWNWPYQAIYYANTVLEGLENMPKSKQAETEANNLRGQALFFRAFFHYLLAQEFAAPYQKDTAESERGIPIRISSNVQNKYTRGKLKEVYDQIVKDLLEAENLLPLHVSYNTRPNRDAGLALLARVYLAMHEYSKALEYSMKCLQSDRKLLDYNSLPLMDAWPFPISYKDQNEEVLFYSTVLSVSFLSSATTTFVDDKLYSTYLDGDLRKQAFFSINPSGVRFKGHYSGTSGVFSGIALDEVYLIKAECNARLGNVNNAMDDLTTLIKTRWDNKSDFPNFKSQNESDALNLILEERRKQMLFRGMRWTDLRRLNLDDRFALTLSRTVNDIEYTLSPNDLRYIFPIPDVEMSISELEQNER